MPKTTTKQSRPEMCWVESREKWRKRKKIGGRYRDIYGDTKQEVRDQIKELEAQEAAGLVLDDYTFLPNYAVSWLKNRTAGLSASGAADYFNAIDKHIVPVLGDIALRDIKPSHVSTVMAECSSLSNRMQSRILGTMRQLMDAAEADGLIIKNPCKGIKAKGAKAPEKTPLTPEQQETLKKAAKGENLELFVLLCLYAGLRREEALGLTWEHVHLNGVPYLDVRATVAYANKGDAQYSDKLKSVSARRSIPLPAILADGLEQVEDKTGFIIAGKKTGNWLPEASYKRYWRIIEKKVDFNVHPHLLRHTYITELCKSGMDIKKIQYLAGHSDPRITLKIYAHVVDNQPEDLIGAVRSAFTPKDLTPKLTPNALRFRVKKRPIDKLTQANNALN